RRPRHRMARLPRARPRRHGRARRRRPHHHRRPQRPPARRLARRRLDLPGTRPPMTWLVTGGAGYIGAHITAALMDAGFDVVVLDDLSTGRAEFVPAGAAFVEGDVRNAEAVLA